MKNVFFCLALGGICQCFSMQPEENFSPEERPITRPMSNESKEMIRQQLATMQEQITRYLDVPVSYFCRSLPKPGFEGLYGRAVHEISTWIDFNMPEDSHKKSNKFMLE